MSFLQHSSILAGVGVISTSSLDPHKTNAQEENTTLRIDTTKTTGAKKGKLAGTEINADRI
jgi:hypothetical protein